MHLATKLGKSNKRPNMSPIKPNVHSSPSPHTNPPSPSVSLHQPPPHHPFSFINHPLTTQFPSSKIRYLYGQCVSHYPQLLVDSESTRPVFSEWSQGPLQEPKIRSDCQRGLFALLISHTCTREHHPPTTLGHVVMDANKPG